MKTKSKLKNFVNSLPLSCLLAASAPVLVPGCSGKSNKPDVETVVEIDKKAIDKLIDKREWTIHDFRDMGWKISDEEMYKVTGLNILLNAQDRTYIEKSIMLGQLAHETLWGKYMKELRPREKYTGFEGAGWIHLTGKKNYYDFAEYYLTFAPPELKDIEYKKLRTPGDAPYLVATKYPTRACMFYWDAFDVGNGSIHKNINRLIKDGESYIKICRRASDAINPREKIETKKKRRILAEQHLEYFRENVQSNELTAVR